MNNNDGSPREKFQEAWLAIARSLDACPALIIVTALESLAIYVFYFGTHALHTKKIRQVEDERKIFLWRTV